MQHYPTSLSGLFFIVLMMSLSGVYARQSPTTTPTDTVPSLMDTLNKRRSLPSFLLWDNLNTKPLYPYQNPFLRRDSPFLIKPEKNQRIEVEVDTAVTYRIYPNTDSTSTDPGYSLDFDDYSRMQEYRIRQQYWRDRSRGLDGESAVGGRGLIPPITMSPTFDRLFGGSEITIVPTGNVNLDFGGIFRRIDNPSIPIRQQKTGNFNFNQQIQMSVNGMLGQKVPQIN